MTEDRTEPEPTRDSPAVENPAGTLDSPETEATVDALVETVRELLKDENSRDQSFNTRGVGLAGFVGIIVSLSTTIGRDALKARWTGPWQPIAVTLFAVALLALVGTVIVVVRGVLRPREAASLAISEVQKYPLPGYVFRPKVINQGSTLRGLIDALVIERGRATSKATGLRWGYRLLILGLTSIAALGFLLGLHDAKLIGAPDGRHPRATPPASRPAGQPAGGPSSARHRSIHRGP